MKRLTNATFDIERIVHFYIKTFVHFDIDIYTDWRKARKYAKKHTVVLTENEANAKICELERENAELRQANEILKDALGFFAKDRKK